MRAAGKWYMILPLSLGAVLVGSVALMRHQNGWTRLGAITISAPTPAESRAAVSGPSGQRTPRAITGWPAEVTQAPAGRHPSPVRGSALPADRLDTAAPDGEQQALIAVIEDPNTDPHDARYAIDALSRVGEGVDAAAAALINYAKRRVDWDKFTTDRQVKEQVLAKDSAIKEVGYIRTPNAKAALLRAVTLQGARDLTQAWLPTMPEYRTLRGEDPAAQFRGDAAVALACFADEAPIQQLLSSEFAVERQRLINAGLTHGAYFNQLCDAMVRMDIIHDIGWDGHSTLRSDNGAYVTMYVQYLVNKGYSIRDHSSLAGLTFK